LFLGLRNFAKTINLIKQIMPRIPKWLGDTIETVFSRMITPVEVTSVEYFLPELKKIVMKGDLSKMHFTPGNVIEFRVTDTEFRHYTISAFNKESQTCEMLIYLHDRGVGSKWAHNLKAGDKIGMMGPTSRIKYKTDYEAHFIFGDETSIGLMQFMAKEAAQRGQSCYCLAELDEPNRRWLESLAISARIVEKEYAPAAKFAVEAILEMPAGSWAQWSSAAFYLTGRAKSIQAVRKALTARGVAMKNIFTEPYWAEGKKGL
jgi:NADPH-dependent ferric siderophore reductase